MCQNNKETLRRSAIKIGLGIFFALLGSELGLKGFIFIVAGTALILWGMRDLGMKSDA